MKRRKLVVPSLPEDRSMIATVIMTVLAQIGAVSVREKGLGPVLLCVFLWAWLLPCTPAQDMGGKSELLAQRGTSGDEWRTFGRRLDPFVQQGTLGGAKITVAADDVLNAIAAGRDVDVAHAVIDGDLDIGRIADRLQRDESGKPVIRGNIGIQGCDIRGYTFSSATFRGNANFSRSTFFGDTDFVGTDFSKYTDFSSSAFDGDVEFTDTTFSGDALFISATFSGKADFKYATFSGESGFRYATFDKSVDFTDATLSGAVDFIEATFTSDAVFLRTSMEHPASFQGVRFRENTVLAGLWNNVLCKILRFLPKRIVTDFSQFDTGSIMDGSSNPYLKRYIDDEQWIKSWRESIWWRELLFVLWEVTSHCGRSIGLWAFWSADIAIFFAFVYWWALSDSITFSVDKLSGVKPGFLGYLYYSIVTLTTLGFGDIVPLTNRARIVVVTEVILGYIMLGGLVSIFANKIASRS